MRHVSIVVAVVLAALPNREDDVKEKCSISRQKGGGGSDLISGVVEGQGELEKFGGVNIKEFEQEYQAVPIDIDDVQKLGDFCEMSHSGGHCGWRAAQMMVNHKGDLPDFVMQLREDYEDESIRGTMRPEPIKYNKSEAERLSLKRKKENKGLL